MGLWRIELNWSTLKCEAVGRAQQDIGMTLAYPSPKLRVYPDRRDKIRPYPCGGRFQESFLGGPPPKTTLNTAKSVTERRLALLAQKPLDCPFGPIKLV